MKKFRILIVDDDDDVDVTLTLKVGLEENGFAVDFFNDAKTALTYFKPQVYDIILIDVKMPTMNGFEFYKEIEKIDKNAKVGFIRGFSVYYESLKQIFPEEDTCFFIKKPIEIDRLVERIQKEMMKS
jgi:two-component system, OmpR family, response regulator ChvI